MNLLERSEKWAAEGAWDKIIERLRASPSVPKSPELTLALTKAYLQKAQENPQYYWEAQRVLDEGSHTSYWFHNYYQGLIDLRLGRPFQALEDLSEFWSWGPQHGNYQNWPELWEEAVSCISLPKPEPTFRESVESAWATFLEREAEFEALVASAENSHAFKQVDDWLFNVFWPAKLGVWVTFTRHEGEPTLLVWEKKPWVDGRTVEEELELLGTSFESDLLCWQYVLDCAPQSVRDRWHLHAGHFPDPEAHLEWICDEMYPATSVKFRLCGSDPNHLELWLYCQALGYAVEFYPEDAQAYLEDLVTRLLGEMTAYRYLKTIRIKSEPFPKARPLTELPAVLAALGITEETEPIRIAPMMERVFKRVRQPTVRTEVQTNVTRIPQLVQEYRKKKHYIFERLLRYGIVAGFLVCNRTDTAPFAPNEEKYLQQKLEAYFAEHAGERVLRVFGYAHSDTTLYLDVFAWDLPNFLVIAKAFFREHTEWCGGFHTYTQEAWLIVLSEATRSPDVVTVPPLVAE